MSDEKLKQRVLLKCIEYGISQDISRIPMLISLYEHTKKHLAPTERMQLLTQFVEMTEEQNGLGIWV